MTFSNCYNTCKWKRCIEMKEDASRPTKLTPYGAVDVGQHWFGDCNILPDSMWFQEIWVWEWFSMWRHQMETFSALQAICGGIPRSPANSPHKGQWHGALMFSLICTWINGWVTNSEVGDLRRHRAHYDVTVMRGDILHCNSLRIAVSPAMTSFVASIQRLINVGLPRRASSGGKYPLCCWI